jgi:hypothetical protein
MAIFKIIFKNRLGLDGETFDLPADKLNSNGAMIESYGYVEREVRDGDGFTRDTWEYEIPDKDADRFLEGLKSTPDIIEYKRQ